MTRAERGFRTDILIGGLIFAFTAVPLDVRLPSQRALLEALSLEIYPIDVVANILGYIPLGIALRKRKAGRAMALAGLLSIVAETAQLFMSDRTPAVLDVVANLAGAALGFALAAKRPLFPEVLVIGPRRAAIAALVAAAYLLLGSDLTVEGVLRKIAVSIEAPPWMIASSRGSTEPGAVEAHLSFDRIGDEAIDDDSVNRLRGVAVNGPTRSAGVAGSAIALDGRQWIDLGDPIALRLTGSMTLSAWVKPTKFPVDDAAIVSSLTDNELGYQLDLTIDQGPRTIGFKIAGASGRLMARYGKTPIVLDRWYHVAGVYDAKLQTLDVYLNGVLDNGCLTGTVTERPLPSRRHAFVGRRAGMAGFEFTGSVDEVTIESRARPAADILAEASIALDSARSEAGNPSREVDHAAQNVCVMQPHARIVGPLLLLGMLLAFACAGLVRDRRVVPLTLGLCLAAGATANVWGLPTAVSTWFAVACVMLGGILVLAAGYIGSAKPVK